VIFTNVWLESLENRLLLSAGELDPSFGVGGKTTTNFNVPLDSQAFKVIPLAGGKLLTFGTINGFDLNQLAITRFLNSGQIDPTFGNAGRVISNIVETPTDAVRSPDGKFLVLGATEKKTLLARFSADGKLDTSFGTSGVVTIGLDIYPSHIGLTADGKIIVGGKMLYELGKSYVARLSADGQLDRTFGDGGSVQLTFLLSSFFVRSDGGILLGGSFASGNGIPPDVGLIRLTGAGKFDARFGSGGSVKTYIFTGNNTMPLQITVDNLGGILVLSGEAVARFRANGHFDLPFANRGVLQLQMYGQQMAVQKDGSVVIVGYGSSDGAVQNLRWERVLAGGSADPSWGAGGVTTVPLPDYRDYPTTIAIADDRSIFGAGSVGHNMGAARLTSDGRIDLTFGDHGLARLIVTGVGDDEATVMAVQADGKYIVGGSSRGRDGSLAAIARYNADGSLDKTFGDSGSVRTQIPGSITSILIDHAGRIVVGIGDSFVRFNADGSLDNSFGIGGRLVIAGANFLAQPLPDGKFLSISTDDAVLSVRRYDAQGAPDPTFAGGNALKLVGLMSGTGSHVLITSNGQMLIAARGFGTDPDSLAVPWVVWRLNSDGTLDQTFGKVGKATAFVGGILYDEPYALAVQKDGKIIAVGVRYSDGSRFALARWDVHGQLDPTFGDHGVVSTVFPPNVGGELGVQPDFASSVVIQKDGKILAVGYHTGNPTSQEIDNALYYGDWGIIRYNADGSLDYSFGKDGKQSISFGLGDNPVDSILTPDGKLVVAGTAGSDSDSGDFGIARFTLADQNLVTARIENRILKISGTAANDTIRLRILDGRLGAAGMPQSFALTSFSRIEINGLAGNDTIDASIAKVSVLIDGGDGNDSLLGGSSSDQLQGSAGNDTLFGGGGADTLRGGDGNDYLNGGPGNDQIFGENGNDQIFSADSTFDTVNGGNGFDRAKSDLTEALSSIEGMLA